MDVQGDLLRFRARGVWTLGSMSRVFSGELVEAESIAADVSDGRLDGDGGSAISLPQFGCRPLGTMQVSVWGTGGCQRASESVSAREGFALCAADFDCSGRLDAEDVLTFLNAWENNQADINQDGTTDGNDIIIFMELWNAGC
jgi:hypothetical protein